MINEYDLTESEYVFSPWDDTDLDPDFSVYSDISSSSYESLKRVKRRKIHHKFNNKKSNSSKNISNLSLPEDDSVFFDGVTIEKQNLQNEHTRIFNEDSVEKLKSKVNDVSDSASITNATIITRSSSSGYLSCSDFDESLSSYAFEMRSEIDHRSSDNDDDSGRSSKNSCSVSSSVLAHDGSYSDNYMDECHEESSEPSNLNFRKLKEIYDNYYFLSEHTIKMFKELCIDIDWPLPKAHSHASSFSVFDHSKMAEELFANGKDLRTGKFSSEEDSIIISNWNRFIMTYGFEEPSHFFAGKVPKKLFVNKEKKKFVQFLGYGLNDRTLRCIYIRFEELFGKLLYNSSGRFTIKEEQVLTEIDKLPNVYFNSNFSKIKLLQCVLMRKKVPICRKIRKLRKMRSQPQKRIIWNLDKMSKLVRLILKHSVSKDFMLVESELTPLQWDHIADKLGCGTGEQLKMFWMSRLCLQLTSKTPIYRNKLRSDLILRLYKWVEENDHKNWKRVDWTIIGTDLSLPPSFLYKKFRKMATTFVPMAKLDSVKDTIDHLYDNFLPILQSGKLKDYCLKRLRYTKSEGLIEID